MEFFSVRNLVEILAAIRRLRAIAAVAELQRQSIQTGKDTITPAEIAAEIASVRASVAGPKFGTVPVPTAEA